MLCLLVTLLLPRAIGQTVGQAGGDGAAVTTFAGNLSGTVGVNNFGHADGIGSAASFYYPTGVAVNAAGTIVIVARDRENSWGVDAAPLM